MQTKPTSEPTGSPVRGVIPEPIRRPDDAITHVPTSPLPPRNLASILLAKLLSALRGDKYMVDAYPPGKER